MTFEHIKPDTKWKKKMFINYANGETEADCMSEDTCDKEIADLVRAGFGVGYCGLFACYRARWGKKEEKKWINVTERLPKEQAGYPVYHEKKGQTYAVYVPERGWTNIDYPHYVTHWYDLPIIEASSVS